MWDRTNGPIYRTAFITSPGAEYGDAGSFQVIQADLNLAAGAGKDVADGTAYLAAVMGNVLGASLTKTGNYLAGVIGAYSLTGTRASTYPCGAVLAQITDGVGTGGTGMPDGAVVAYIDGDGSSTLANAAYAVMSNNSTASSGFQYGLNLQAAAHDGYQAVDAAFYKKAHIRLTEDVCILTGSAAPTDGVTGAAVTGSGSMYIRSGDGNGAVYINTNTKASPSWKLVTHA